MQFSDIYNEVLTYGFNDGPQVYVGRIKRWINEGQQRLAREVDAPEFQETFTITTTGGVSTYALPADFIRDADIGFPSMITRLLPIDLSQFDQFAGDPSLAILGPPSQYTLYQSNVLLYPTPDTVYTLLMHYTGRPPDLVFDADIPELNSDYHDLLVTYAAMRAFEAEDDYEAAQFWLGKWQRERGQYATDMNNRQRDRPRLIPGTFAGSFGGGGW
jgi:hypothetical protein